MLQRKAQVDLGKHLNVARGGLTYMFYLNPLCRILKTQLTLISVGFSVGPLGWFWAQNMVDLMGEWN